MGLSGRVMLMNAELEDWMADDFSLYVLSYFSNIDILSYSFSM